MNFISTTPITQLAAQYDPRINAICLNEVPIPSITDPNQLLVKIASASLCHSDLMLLEPNEQGLLLNETEPVTIGHEAIGEILQAGSSTKGFEIGDVIGFLCIVDCCYECEECQIHNLFCENGKSKVQGLGVDGFFQKYVTVDYRNAVRIPTDMDPKSVAPLCCAGVTSFNAVSSSELNPGEWLAIIGCGGLGHLGIQYAKAMGFRVIGIDISQASLVEAQAQGADYVFNPCVDKNYAQKIKELTGKGCHAAINFTNSLIAYSTMADVLRVNGVLMVVGIPLKPLTFRGVDVSLGRFRIKGSNNGTRKILEQCIAFSHKHGIVPHVEYYRLDQINEMVELMSRGGQRGRMVVTFDSEAHL